MSCFNEGDHCLEFTVDVCTQIWARERNVLPLLSTCKVTNLAFQRNSVGMLCISDCEWPKEKDLGCSMSVTMGMPFAYLDPRHFGQLKHTKSLTQSLLKGSV